MAITKFWTPEDIAHLLRLEASGATLFGAAAALGRQTTSVQKKAHQLGKSFPGARAVKASLRKSGAIPVSDREQSRTSRRFSSGTSR